MESLDDQGVTNSERLELFQGQAKALHFGAQQLTWFEDGFDGQLKGTPVDRYRLLRAHVKMNLDHLRRVDVRRAHEVARRVGADRNHREIKRPEAFTNLFEIDIVISGVAGEVTVEAIDRYRPSAPQGAVGIPGSTFGPVLRRFQGHLNALVEAVAVPPVSSITRSDEMPCRDR